MLEQIVDHKQAEVAQAKRAVPIERLAELADAASPPRDFVASLRAPGVSLIAEIKRRSPSKGDFAPGLCASDTARTYALGGAAALSVLTDERFFAGTLDDLRAARQALDEIKPSIPILRKDFILDAYQIEEARAAGADAVLLIVRTLSDKMFRTLHEATLERGMSALVEVFDPADIERIRDLDPPLVGINLRNLADFSVDRSSLARLRSLLPEETLVVAASGVRTREDVDAAHIAGADAVLVGEALVTASDLRRKVNELSGRTGGQSGSRT